MNTAPDKMEDWLQHMLTKTPGVLLDVGAYRGDFSHVMLTKGICTEAHLFEPHPLNHSLLAQRFADRKGLFVHPVAIGRHSETQTVTLHSTIDSATASTLAYSERSTASISYEITSTSLDSWFSGHKDSEVKLLKIDTQGADLEVLLGADNLIAAWRPWIVVEAIFVPLYDNQVAPWRLLEWAATHGYALAGAFNEHWTPTGQIAFLDWVLAPHPFPLDPTTSFIPRHSTQDLAQRIRELEFACEERLRLIDYLHKEAAKRLQIIESLTAENSKPS